MQSTKGSVTWDVEELGAGSFELNIKLTPVYAEAETAINVGTQLKTHVFVGERSGSKCCLGPECCHA